MSFANCQFELVDQVPTCQICGRVMKAHHPPPWTAPCKAAKSRGLGDTVSKGLASVGVTKARVSKVLGRPCPCPKFQRVLNALVPYGKKE